MYVKSQEVRKAESKLASDQRFDVENISKDYRKPKVKFPRLQIFEDGKDDLGSCIERFERFPRIAEWPNDWVVCIGARLSGRALQVYSSLSRTLAHMAETLIVSRRVKGALKIQLNKVRVWPNLFRIRPENFVMYAGNGTFGERLFSKIPNIVKKRQKGIISDYG